MQWVTMMHDIVQKIAFLVMTPGPEIYHYGGDLNKNHLLVIALKNLVTLILNTSIA